MRISSQYLRLTTSGNIILSSAIECLYNSNIETDQRPDPGKLLSKRVELIWQLECWRDSLASVDGLVAMSDLDTLPVTKNDVFDVRIMLSIQYYRLLMVINFPIIALLLESLGERNENSCTLNQLRQAVVPVIQNDWNAVTQFRHIVQAIMFTATLHLSAMLLVFKHIGSLTQDLSVIDVRQEIEQSLSVMEMVGKTNLMTQKTRQCMQRLLSVFDNLGAEPLAGTVTPSPSQTATEFIMQNIEIPAQEFLVQWGQDDFFGSDCSFFDIYAGITGCE
ncbi:hypothetical protein BO71DRAFT_430575 [Aspergillus ellipticus CBS 707.79]|uniref:Transcription factor domain-containing protein n=1 Tax=Aspergillus ellipticus CBS 707.79 TaxID=1448320 RepID=A0A319DRH1_9EURO|nr:hypothetical protein BO71DRAFT_430575 [Aspergillus ellipticus CBS 707.79]